MTPLDPTAPAASAPAPTAPLIARLPSFRCLGGIPVLDGRRVRPGVLLRAPALWDITAEEAAVVEALAPAIVADFRHEEEVAARPVPWPGSIAARRIALPVRSGPLAIAMATAREGLDAATARAAMIASYRDFVRVDARTFAAFLRTVAQTEGGAVLFHCTAGKDRTGFAAALLLLALGATRATVMEDFLSTARLWSPDEALLRRIPPAAHGAVFGLEPDYLDAALDELERAHGGALAFAHAAMGAEGHRAFVERSLA